MKIIGITRKSTIIDDSVYYRFRIDDAKMYKLAIEYAIKNQLDETYLTECKEPTYLEMECGYNAKTKNVIDINIIYYFDDYETIRKFRRASKEKTNIIKLIQTFINKYGDKVPDASKMEHSGDAEYEDAIDENIKAEWEKLTLIKGDV